MTTSDSLDPADGSATEPTQAAAPDAPATEPGPAGRLARRVAGGATQAWRRRPGATDESAPETSGSLSADADGSAGHGPAIHRSAALQQLLDEYGPPTDGAANPAPRPVESVGSTTVGSMTPAASSAGALPAQPGPSDSPVDTPADGRPLLVDAAVGAAPSVPTTTRISGSSVSASSPATGGSSYGGPADSSSSDSTAVAAAGAGIGIETPAGPNGPTDSAIPAASGAGAEFRAPVAGGPLSEVRTPADGFPRGVIATPRPVGAALHTPDAGSGGPPTPSGPARTISGTSGRGHSRRPLMFAAAIAVAATAGIGVAASTLFDSTGPTPAGDGMSTVRVLETSSVTPQGTAPSTAAPTTAPTAAATPPATTSASSTPPAAPAASVTPDLLPQIIPTDAPTLPVDTGSAVVSSLAPGDPGFGWPTTDPATP